MPDAHARAAHRGNRSSLRFYIKIIIFTLPLIRARAQKTTGIAPDTRKHSILARTREQLAHLLPHLHVPCCHPTDSSPPGHVPYQLQRRYISIGARPCTKMNTVRQRTLQIDSSVCSNLSQASRRLHRGAQNCISLTNGERRLHPITLHYTARRTQHRRRSCTSFAGQPPKGPTKVRPSPMSTNCLFNKLLSISLHSLYSLCNERSRRAGILHHTAFRTISIPIERTGGLLHYSLRPTMKLPYAEERILDVFSITI